MKKPPLSETQFDQLTPDALSPNGFDDDGETDWSTWAAGSGVACVGVLILAFLNIQWGHVFFKGHSAEFAENMNYFLFAMTAGFGLYSVYAIFKAYTVKNKAANKLRAHKKRR
jgi:hypothetical protein